MSNYEILNSFVQFKNKKEMDEHVTKYRLNIGYKLNKTDNKILSYMMQHAVRYTGVFYQLIETIAANNKVSVATVKRVLAKLVKLNLLKRIPTFRKRRGGKGATIFQFQFFKPKNEPLKLSHCNKGETSTESKDEQGKINTKPFISPKKDLKDLKTSTQGKPSIGIKKVVSFYEKLKALYKARTGTVNNFRELIGVIYGSMKKYKNDIKIRLPHSRLEGIMYASLDACLCKKGVENLAAMLTVIIRNKVNDVIAEAMPKKGAKHEKVPDWFYKQKEEQRQRTEQVIEEVPGIDFEAERTRLMKILYGNDWEPNN